MIRSWAQVLGVGLATGLLLAWPLSALDGWLSAARLFPAPVASTGLLSIAVATAAAAAWLGRSSPRRAAAAGGLTLALCIGAVWALRYMVWHSFGADTEVRLSGASGHRFAALQWLACGAAAALCTALASTRRIGPRAALIHLCSTAGAIVLADLIVSAAGIDAQLMNKALYYQTVEIEAHMPVADAELLYALRPSTVHGGEGPWGVRDVRINSLGARSPEYAATKAPGTRRVLFFGGSTLYGAGVGNRDTTPAQLERLLRSSHPATEVWNFGACAYNTAQSTQLAADKIAELDPDLVLVLITNTGRRAFMGGPDHQGDDKSDYFSDNPFLYLENFPPTVLPEGPHLALMRVSALYRSASAWARVYTDPDTTYADMADAQGVAALEAAAQAAGVRVVYVLSPSRGSEVGPQDLGVPPERWVDLHIPGRGGDYTEAHPPPAVLREYAQAIAAAL